MKRFVIAALVLCLVSLSVLCGCEGYTASDTIHGIVTKNDLSVEMKVEHGPGHQFTVETCGEEDDEAESCLKISVENEFSLRGEAKIEPGKKYRISFTLKNESADPLICYSFWKMPVTSKRYFVLAGEDGNPPESKTQQTSGKWVTYSEMFEVQEGEDAFVLSLRSQKGVFYIKEIIIEEIRN